MKMVPQGSQFSLPLAVIFTVDTQYMQRLDLSFHLLVRDMGKVSFLRPAVQTHSGLSACLFPVLKTAATVMLATADSKVGLSKNFGTNTTGEIVHRPNKFVVKPSIRAATLPS